MSEADRVKSSMIFKPVHQDVIERTLGEKYANYANDPDKIEEAGAVSRETAEKVESTGSKFNTKGFYSEDKLAEAKGE